MQLTGYNYRVTKLRHFLKSKIKSFFYAILLVMLQRAW